MCSNYRMSSNNATKKPEEEEGFFSGLLTAAKNATSKATAAVTGNKPNSTKNGTNTSASMAPVAPVAPVTAGVNMPIKGGAASVSYSVPGNQRQPSEAVMNWATTAGAPTPSAAEMRNVAHGGSRRNRNKSRRNKSCGGTVRNKLNRNISRRNKSCGGTLRNKRNRSRRNRSH